MNMSLPLLFVDFRFKIMAPHSCKKVQEILLHGFPSFQTNFAILSSLVVRSNKFCPLFSMTLSLFLQILWLLIEKEREMEEELLYYGT